MVNESTSSNDCCQKKSSHFKAFHIPTEIHESIASVSVGVQTNISVTNLDKTSLSQNDSSLDRLAEEKRKELKLCKDRTEEIRRNIVEAEQKLKDKQKFKHKLMEAIEEAEGAGIKEPLIEIMKEAAH